MKSSHYLIALVAATVALSGCASGAATSGAANKSEAACSQAGTTGITDTTIKIGNSSPQSGVVASLGTYQQGIKAYFTMINASGGVKGADGKKRKIDFTSMDDGYDPTRARTNVQTMINQDKVYAFVGNLGTAAGLAVRPIVEAACVPNLFELSGDPAISDPKHPTTLGLAAISQVEGKIYADYLKKNKPDAKVAVLAQAGAYGDQYIDGFKQGISGSKVTIVASASFQATDTDVRQQVTTLAASDADTLYMAALPTQGLQALNNAAAINWKPDILLPSGTAIIPSMLTTLNPGAGENVILASYAKNLSSPEAATDPALIKYNEWWAKTPGGSSYPIGAGVVGWLAGQLFVQAFEDAKSIDRDAVVTSAHNMTLRGPSTVVKGVTVQTKSPTDNYLLEGELLQKYDPATKTMTDLQIIDTNGKN